MTPAAKGPFENESFTLKTNQMFSVYTPQEKCEKHHNHKSILESVVFEENSSSFYDGSVSKAGLTVEIQIKLRFQIAQMERSVDWTSKIH